MSMGGHQSAKMKNDEWITPRWVTNALGSFDLDPCAPICPPWAVAASTYNQLDDGLSKEWTGRVWLNPPYGLQATKWLKKLADHGRGTALIFARTETAMFFEQVWSRATAVLFIEGRLFFHYVDGTKASANAGAPSVLVAYGEQDARVLESCTLPGKFIRLRGVV